MPWARSNRALFIPVATPARVTGIIPPGRIPYCYDRICMKTMNSRLSKKLLVQLGLLVLFLPFQAAAATGKTVSLLPAPLHLQYLEGSYSLPETAVISMPDDRNSSASAKWFAELIRQHRGQGVRVAAGSEESATIRAERISPKDLQSQFEKANLTPAAGLDEAYSLQVTPAGVLIQAAGDAGL